MKNVLFRFVPLLVVATAQAESPDYAKEVVPILQKYCAGCHNEDDREGEFSVESFAALQQGGERGTAFLAGQANASRLVRVLTGEAEPKMPPEDNEAPSAAEIELLRSWIDAGAMGPDGKEPDRRQLRTPKIEPAIGRPGITTVAASSDGSRIAIARFGHVEIIDAATGEVQKKLDPFPGKVNAVHFSADGSQLVTASGIVGLYGSASQWKLEDGSLVREYSGHRDTLYDAELSPDGKLLATSSYDNQIIVWETETGEERHRFSGHNDAVYDLAYSPDGTVLASASGDETVKLWHLEQGIRLDTLHQPQAEQYVVQFSPDGRHILAGGADNRIRVWRFVSREKQQINPLLFARYAHEGALVGLAFSPDGKSLVSVGEDRSIKAWEVSRYSQIHLFERQSDVVTGIAFLGQGSEFLTGRLDGSTARYSIAAKTAKVKGPNETAAAPHDSSMTTNRVAEHEPNDELGNAMRIFLPAQVEGIIGSTDSDRADQFRFTAKADQSWILESNAARLKSPLDTRLEVLDAAGKPITRMLLQAVRDSYFTFRGQNSDTSDGFRLHNWEEMDVNQYLYAAGEVVKLWHYPRGPDSGFQLYPGRGTRFTYFDTTPASHPLQEPCYIVEVRAATEELIPNGLPVFPIFYENDDDSRRELGTDSRLTFTAPADGEYLVRLTDARGFSGSQFKYELSIRPRRPDFTVSLEGANPTVNAGSGREFSVTAQRIDGFEGEIKVEITDLPPGFFATSPLVIETGQTMAFGTINALADAPEPTPENAKMSKVSGTATIRGKGVRKESNNLGEIKLAEKSKLTVRVATADAEDIAELVPAKPLELTIEPGQTIAAKVIVERTDFEGRVGFGNADSGRNLPHGVYVDSIGLNGLLIVEGQSERTFYITAASWVAETTRPFHLRAQVEGNQTSWPILLHVKQK